MGYNKKANYPLNGAHTEAEVYNPSPEDIEREAGLIRCGWSESEHWVRAGYEDGNPPWRIPRLHAKDNIPPDLNIDDG